MDMVSLPSIRNVELAYYADTRDPTDLPPPFLERMIAEGKTGVPGGQGFYRHPNPEYEQPDWLTGGAPSAPPDRTSR
jgi:3-hydroxyacyl-CoA dehydrogenase